VSPLWRPTPSMDRELAKSKELQLQLVAVVKELNHIATAIKERTERLEHEQEAGESE
jgi:hypothetical protein